MAPGLKGAFVAYLISLLPARSFAFAINVSAANAAASAEAAFHTSTGLHSIQIQKQYVPVKKDDKVVAYKTAFFGSIHVGAEHSQKFTVVFDTGSGHLILPSTSCNSDVCALHRRYNRTLSTSATDIEYDGTVIQPSAVERDQVSIAFGTGEIQGEFVQEAMCFDGDKQSCVDMRIVLATEMTPDPFGLFAFDGVLGLGLEALTLAPQFSFFSQMMKQHEGMKPQFSVFLARYDGGDSKITFGGYDKSRAVSEMKWSPVAMQDLGYWLVQLKGVRIGDTVLDECEDGSCRAILDSGTSLLGVPRELTRVMHRLLARSVAEEHKGDDGDVDCRNVPGNDLHFDLGDHVVSIKEEDYSRPTPFNMTLPGRTDGAWKLFCRSLLLPVDMEAPLGPKIFILGEPVLRRYYTVYDWGEKRIGFSEARELPEDVKGLPPVGAPPPGSLISGAPISPRKKKDDVASQA